MDSSKSTGKLRTHWHHYTVTVRTISISRELATVEVTAIADAIHATARKPARKNRGCPA